MKECREYKELLPLALYPDSGDKEVREILEHAEKCESCRKELAELENMKIFINQRKRPEMSDQYWDELSEKIDARIDEDEEQKKNNIISLKKFVYPVTAAALVMIGISIGRYFPGESELIQNSAQPLPLPVNNTGGSSAQLTPAVSRHFDSLTPLLLECTNYQQKGDITLDRKDVRNLLLENRILKQIVAKQNNLTEKQLLDELEIILMELSNSSPKEAGNIVKESGIIMKMKSLSKKSTSL